MRGRFLIGIALGAIFLYLSVRQVNLREAWETLRQARYHYFVGFLLLNFVGLWVRSVRWRMLLDPVRVISSGRLLSPLCIGMMANFIFPARAGEFVRAYLVGRREEISKSSAFATVVVERLFDGLAIISFLALAPFLLPSLEGRTARVLQWSGLGIFVFYFSVLAVLLVLSHHRDALSGYLARSSLASRWKVVARIFRMVMKFADGLAILKTRGEAFSALALSYAVWIIAGVINLMMMRAIGLDLPLYAAFFLVVVQSFGVMVPSPGFVGGYQAAHVFALLVYGVPESQAFSLSILIHAGYFFTFVGLGLFFLGREHLGLGELRQATAEEP
jgi:uncharacterized protein (TIRG00374 family)